MGFENQLNVAFGTVSAKGGIPVIALILVFVIGIVVGFILSKVLSNIGGGVPKGMTSQDVFRQAQGLSPINNQQAPIQNNMGQFNGQNMQPQQMNNMGMPQRPQQQMQQRPMQSRPQQMQQQRPMQPRQMNNMQPRQQQMGGMQQRPQQQMQQRPIQPRPKQMGTFPNNQDDMSQFDNTDNFF